MNQELKLRKQDSDFFEKIYQQTLASGKPMDKQLFLNILMMQFSVPKKEAQLITKMADDFSRVGSNQNPEKLRFFLLLKLTQLLQNDFDITTVNIFETEPHKKLEIRKAKKQLQQQVAIASSQKVDFPSALDQVIAATSKFEQSQYSEPKPDLEKKKEFDDIIPDISESHILTDTSINRDHNSVAPQSGQQNQIQSPLQQSDITPTPQTEGDIKHSSRLEQNQIQPPVDQGINDNSSPENIDIFKGQDEDDYFEVIDFEKDERRMFQPVYDDQEKPGFDSKFKKVEVLPFKYVKDGYISGHYICRIQTTYLEEESTSVLEVDRRYNDFTMLQDYLAEKYVKTRGEILPLLPEKHSAKANIISMISEPKELLEERRKALQQYLTELVHGITNADTILYKFLSDKQKFEVILTNLRNRGEEDNLPNPQDYYLQNRISAINFNDLTLFNFLAKDNTLNSRLYEQFKRCQINYSKIQDKYRSLNSFNQNVLNYYRCCQFNLNKPISESNKILTQDILTKSDWTIQRVGKGGRWDSIYMKPVLNKIQEIQREMTNVFNTIDIFKRSIEQWDLKRQRAQKDPKFATHEILEDISREEEMLNQGLMKLNQNLDVVIKSYSQHVSILEKVFTENILKAFADMNSN